MVCKSKWMGMSIRRWIALGSMIWAVAIYTIWLKMFGPAPLEVFQQSRVQCDAAWGAQPYGYAECLRAAASTFNMQYGAVASTATLIAILPVVAVWTLLFALWVWRSSDPIHYGLTSAHLTDRG
jgi:hypothetical protein